MISDSFPTLRSLQDTAVHALNAALPAGGGTLSLMGSLEQVRGECAQMLAELHCANAVARRARVFEPVWRLTNPAIVALVALRDAVTREIEARNEQRRAG